MSRDGLEFLFRRFSRCTVETNMGPTTALVNLVSERPRSAVIIIE
jgi:hypothetical protein